jgi:diguanylate cyclase (GGDEF)-like protein
MANVSEPNEGTGSKGTKMRINVAPSDILDTILKRKRWEDARLDIIDLKEMLKNILVWANRFVPSESGSIFLDDPTLDQQKKKSGLLYFVACFGKGSSELSGTTIPSDVGIVGKTYMGGEPYISKKVSNDNNFYPVIDEKTKFHTKSIVCAPIRIKKVTIGVVELINRLGRIDYDDYDLSLLKIFAEYTSNLVQNSLDAKRFSELSIRDNLTGLYNDRYFYDSLVKEVPKALSSGSPLSLLFMDLDWFKEVNDNHGHLAGSRVLAEVGDIINNSTDDTGYIPTRYGGDEFVIILPDSDKAEALRYAEDLRKAIESYVFLRKKGHGVEKALKIKGQITASIGLSTLNPDGKSKSSSKEVRETLIKKADSAMYHSKENGRNMVTAAD